MVENDNFIWVEKWRPRKIDDCILPEAMKDYFKTFLAKGEIQNMILSGSPGVGKTTVARALCEELGCDYMIINGSEESGIDVLRTKIKQFASTVSFSGKTKVVILDEADYLNPNSTQPALRAFIEEFANNCRFILTCNYKNRIIPPLHSRCAVVEFKIPKEQKPQIAKLFFKRVIDILDQEGVEANPKAVAALVQKFFPDYRRVLNELQRYSANGKIDEGILINAKDANFSELIKSLREKDWKAMRQWVVQNEDQEIGSLYTEIFNNLQDKINEVPQLVLIIADYSYKSAFTVDQTINLTACLTEVMATVSFK